MSEILTKKEAIEFLGLDEKIFDNYFKSAKEIPCLPRNGDKGRFYFDKKILEDWRESISWRTVELNNEDYATCLDFALAQHFRSYVTSDWGTGRQREFGQKITNWMKGQLGEVAVKKFLKREFGVDIALDFSIHEEGIVPQDIAGIFENGKMRTPNIGIGIKSSKPKSAYLILTENEISLDGRKSDAYIFCRPDIPDDHLLRLGKDKVVAMVKNQQHYSKYADIIPDLKNISCEIAGWAIIQELEKVTEIPGQKFDGVRHVMPSGKLHRDKNSWEALIKRL